MHQKSVAQHSAGKDQDEIKIFSLFFVISTLNTELLYSAQYIMCVYSSDCGGSHHECFFWSVGGGVGGLRKPNSTIAHCHRVKSRGGNEGRNPTGLKNISHIFDK